MQIPRFIKERSHYVVRQIKWPLLRLGKVVNKINVHYTYCKESAYSTVRHIYPCNDTYGPFRMKVLCAILDGPKAFCKCFQNARNSRKVKKLSLQVENSKNCFEKFVKLGF